MNLSQPLERARQLYGERTAIVDNSYQCRLTYLELHRRVIALADSLSASGLRHGDCVACLAPNCHQYMELYFACAMLGLILNPLNFRLNQSEIAAVLDDSSARAIFIHESFKELAEQALSINNTNIQVIHIEAPGRKSYDKSYESFLSLDGSRAPNQSNMAYPEIKADDIAQLYYTSGTTGLAKGVILDHRNCAANATGAIIELKLDERDTWLHAAPMFHLVDAWAIWAISWVGGKHVIVQTFKPDIVASVIEKEKVTITALVPTMLQLLLTEPQTRDISFESLRLMLTAGSPVAPDIVKQTCRKLGCDYAQFYGMTETSPFLTISLLPPALCELPEMPESELLELKARTGRPFFGVDVRVVKEDGTDVEADNSEVGEIIARGANVTRGYWKKPDITEATIKNGWIYTGDLAVIDKYGIINIVDRKKDMIITGGENVYSTEVEYALYEHPAVLECAVFGIPHEKWGEEIKAVVVLAPGEAAEESTLIEFVREKLAHYKAPRSIDFMDSLPKTGSGKIFKKGLRDSYWSSSAKKVN